MVRLRIAQHPETAGCCSQCRSVCVTRPQGDALSEHVPADNHTPWVSLASCTKGSKKAGPDRDHLLGDWFGESPEYFNEDYTSTAEPDSDDESLAEWDSKVMAMPSAIAGDDRDVDRIDSTSANSTLPSVLAAAVPAVSWWDSPKAPNCSVGGSSPAASVLPSATCYARRIVEFCCGADSRIGQRAPADCEVIRLTIEDDLTTQAGLEKALAAVSDPSVPTLLFGAIPCTGGSPYQHLNWMLGPSTRDKIRQRRAIYRKLWRNFVLVADRCRANGGRIAIEWPRGCMYWRDRRVTRCLKRWNLESFELDGCRFGLRSQATATKGKLLRKPWRIAPDCVDFWRMADECNHQPHEHCKTAGADTKRTESYTDRRVDDIHTIWGCHVRPVSERAEGGYYYAS